MSKRAATGPAAAAAGGPGSTVLDVDAPILAIVVRAARSGAQFVIATHSPILLACPAALIDEQ